MMGSEFGYGFGYGFHGLGMVVFWLLFVILMVLLVRGVSGGNGNRDDKSAREILDERFASGEIQQDEYEERKKVLT